MSGENILVTVNPLMVEAVLPEESDIIEVLIGEPERVVQVVVPDQFGGINVITGGQTPEWTYHTKITVSNTPPPSPSIGDLWVDTN